MQQDLAPVPALAPDTCSLHQPDPGTALYPIVLAHVLSRERAADTALIGRATNSCWARLKDAVESPGCGLKCPERHEQLEDLGSAGPLRWRERAPEGAGQREMVMGGCGPADGIPEGREGLGCRGSEWIPDHNPKFIAREAPDLEEPGNSLTFTFVLQMTW